MNIIQVQDSLKDFSQDQLVNEMQNPSGQAPQFLVLSELQRRKRMTAAYEGRQAIGQPTVAEEAVASAGIPSLQAQQMGQSLAPHTSIAQNTGAMDAAGMQPPSNAGMAPPDPMQGYAEGGIVVRNGRRISVGDNLREDLIDAPIDFLQRISKDRRGVPSSGRTEEGGRTPNPHPDEFDLRYDAGVGVPTLTDNPTDALGAFDFSEETPTRPTSSLWRTAISDPSEHYAPQELAPVDLSDEKFTAPMGDIDETDDARASRGTGRSGDISSLVRPLVDSGRRTVNVPSSRISPHFSPQGMQPGPIQTVEPSQRQPFVTESGDFNPEFWTKNLGRGPIIDGRGGEAATPSPHPDITPRQGSNEMFPPINDPFLQPGAELSFPTSDSPTLSDGSPSVAVRPPPSGGGAGGSPSGGSSIDQLLASRYEALDAQQEQDKWLALAQAGMAMMASKNPNFLGAIGEGGQAGLEAYRDVMSDYNERRGDLADAELSIAASREAAARKAASGGSSDDDEGGLNSLPNTIRNSLQGDAMDALETINNITEDLARGGVMDDSGFLSREYTPAEIAAKTRALNDAQARMQRYEYLATGYLNPQAAAVSD